MDASKMFIRPRSARFTKPQWQYDDGGWQAFTKKADEVESAYRAYKDGKGEPTFDLNLGYNQQYTLDFVKMTQNRVRFSTERPIRRQMVDDPSLSRPPSGNRSKLAAIFKKYVDADEDDQYMSQEGMLAFLAKVGVDPEGVAPLAIAVELEMSEMGFYERTEFIDGFAALGCSTQTDIQRAVKAIVAALQGSDRDVFRRFWKFLFLYVKGDDRKRTISKELAVHVWRTALPKGAKFPLLEPFLAFITDDEDVATVSKDLWEQTLQFLSTTDAACSNFDEASGWPIAIDCFAEHHREARAG